MSFSRFKRENTLKIEFCALYQPPNVSDIEEAIHGQLQLAENDMKALVLCNYRKKIDLKLRRKDLVDETISKCYGELSYYLENMRLFLC